MRRWVYLYSFRGWGRNRGEQKEPVKIQPRGRNEMPWAWVEEKQTSSFPKGLTNCLTNSRPQGGQFHLKPNHLGSCTLLPAPGKQEISWKLGMRQQVNAGENSESLSPTPFRVRVPEADEGKTMHGLCATNRCLSPGLVRRQKENKEVREHCHLTNCLCGCCHLLCGRGTVSELTEGPREPPEMKQLTWPLEKMNTRAAPAAVIAQVKKVPSKAWNTEL